MKGPFFLLPALLLFSCSGNVIPDEQIAFFDSTNYDSLGTAPVTGEKVVRRKNVAPPDGEGKTEVKRIISHTDSCKIIMGTYSVFEFNNFGLLNKLRNFAFGNYIGKPVKELLYNDTIKSYPKSYWKEDSAGNLKGVQLEFAKGLYINILTHKLKYVPAYDANGKWDWKLFQKEKISTIEVEIQ